MADFDYNDIFIKEPFSIYLKKSEEYLTSHQLMDFSRCPRLYHLKKIGALLSDPNKDSAEMILGRAAHTLILEGQSEFEWQYSVGGPINDKTGKEYGRETQAYAKWLDMQKSEKGSALDAITTDQWYTISNMAKAVHSHQEAALLLRVGFPERVIRTEILGVPIQARFDWFTEIGETPVIVDLKTCNDIDSFIYDAKKYLYGIQFAFYQNAFAYATDDVSDMKFADVYAIVVEKREPFRCGVFKVSHSMLDRYAKKVEDFIRDLQRLQEADWWPTLYEEVRELELE
ncbi:MAG: PD-(D/E)XK nuclease-like domain-containing protein [Planctomycetaceae bacterium]|nr:PD-(D/E)XK nuclease-like domain-containing protein [Planctomycetaceae bacterium]